MAGVIYMLVPRAVELHSDRRSIDKVRGEGSLTLSKGRTHSLGCKRMGDSTGKLGGSDYVIAIHLFIFICAGGNDCPTDRSRQERHDM